MVPHMLLGQCRLSQYFYGSMAIIAHLSVWSLCHVCHGHKRSTTCQPLRAHSAVHGDLHLVIETVNVLKFSVLVVSRQFFAAVYPLQRRGSSCHSWKDPAYGKYESKNRSTLVVQINLCYEIPIHNVPSCINDEHQVVRCHPCWLACLWI